jgi:hypothetical protein
MARKWKNGKGTTIVQLDNYTHKITIISLHNNNNNNNNNNNIYIYSLHAENSIIEKLLVPKLNSDKYI